MFNNNMTTNMSCTLTEYEVLYNTVPHKLYLILTPFIICIGLIGNILSVCVFILTDLKKHSVSIVTIALAIADSFVLMIPVSILWLEKVLRRELTDQSPFWCHTHGFFDLTFTSCSSWLMVCIAFERFCAVWLPHDNKTMFTHGKTFIIVIVIVSTSTILSTWFIFVVKAVRIQTLSLKNSSENSWQISDNRTIVQSWRCNIINDSLYDSMGMFSVVMNYIIPFIFVLLLNSTVIYRLCQRGIVELRSSITVMLTLVCIVHLFCTLPFQCWWIYYEVRDQTGDCSWLQTKLKWRTITFSIRNLNYMANFLLYSCSSKLFRNELKSLIALSLLPHEKYENYHYRRQSLYDNMRRQRFSLSQLIMKRLNRTNEYRNAEVIQSLEVAIPLNYPNERH